MSLLLGCKYPAVESSTLEFKQQFTNAALTNYRKCVSAFANTNGGLLVFGVNDQRVNVGIRIDNGEEDKIRLAFDGIYRDIVPNVDQLSIQVTMRQLTVNLGLITVAVIRLSGGAHPLYHVSLHDSAYKRLNASNMECVDRMSSYNTIKNAGTKFQAENERLKTAGQVLTDAGLALECENTALKRELALSESNTEGIKHELAMSEARAVDLKSALEMSESRAMDLERELEMAQQNTGILNQYIANLIKRIV